MVREIPKADVIITNPTHYAVALRYERETMQAPMLTAKGIDSIALKIREIARENNVRIIENRPLAQRLYKDVEIGDIIPEELYSVVVIIYSELYRERGFRQTA
jgi:flagellar biosynthetic protein FlhB